MIHTHETRFGIFSPVLHIALSCLEFFRVPKKGLSSPLSPFPLSEKSLDAKVRRVPLGTA